MARTSVSRPKLILTGIVAGGAVIALVALGQHNTDGMIRTAEASVPTISAPATTAAPAATYTLTAQPVTAGLDRDTALTVPASMLRATATENGNARNAPTLTATKAGTPTHGAASVSGGALVYTPAAGYTGDDSFSYTVTWQGQTSTSTVTVTVYEPATSSSTSGGTGSFGDGDDHSSRHGHVCVGTKHAKICS